MKHLLLWVTVVLSSESLFINWTPHADNRWLTVAYQCGSNFQAVNIFDIDSGMSSLRAHLVEVPRNTQCSVQVDVVRGAEDSLFDDGHVAESTTTSISTN